jgi:hypothetical protein
MFGQRAAKELGPTDRADPHDLPGAQPFLQTLI